MLLLVDTLVAFMEPPSVNLNLIKSVINLRLDVGKQLLSAGARPAYRNKFYLAEWVVTLNKRVLITEESLQLLGQDRHIFKQSHLPGLHLRSFKNARLFVLLILYLTLMR